MCEPVLALHVPMRAVSSLLIQSLPMQLGGAAVQLKRCATVRADIPCNLFVFMQLSMASLPSSSRE